MKGVASYLKFESHLDKNQVGETFFANHNDIIRISCKMAKR